MILDVFICSLLKCEQVPFYSCLTIISSYSPFYEISDNHECPELVEKLSVYQDHNDSIRFVRIRCPIEKHIGICYCMLHVVQKTHPFIRNI